MNSEQTQAQNSVRESAESKDLDPTQDIPDDEETVPLCAICQKSGSGPNADQPLKACSRCHSVSYCSVECQRQDWKTHKPLCLDADTVLMEQMKNKTLSYDHFESIKKLGDGNFTKVFQVYHKQFPHKYYALKICEIMKV
jgi:hypothetical protein